MQPCHIHIVPSYLLVSRMAMDTRRVFILFCTGECMHNHAAVSHVVRHFSMPHVVAPYAPFAACVLMLHIHPCQCGGGARRRSVTCMSTTRFIDNTEAKCIAYLKPVTAMQCNMQACNGECTMLRRADVGWELVWYYDAAWHVCDFMRHHDVQPPPPISQATVGNSAHVHVPPLAASVPAHATSHACVVNSSWTMPHVSAMVHPSNHPRLCRVMYKRVLVQPMHQGQ